MKKLISMMLAACLMLVATAALAEPVDLTAGYSGKIAYTKIATLTAPFGGMLEDYDLRVGDAVKAGDVLFTLRTTKVYAPIDGTVRGLMAQAGDAAATVQARYDALVYLEPSGRFILNASTANAYKNSSNDNVNRYLNPGETVYLRSSDDNARTGVGRITAVTGRNFTVEVLESNLIMEDTVSVYRDQAYSTEHRLASYAKVQKAALTAITAEGSILRVAVSEGQPVKRGDLLFETVDGALDGLAEAQSTVVAPVDGVLVSLPQAAGNAVQQDAVLATLYAAENLMVTLDVNESDLDTIQVGTEVNVTLDAWPEMQPLRGSVTAMSAVNNGDTNDAVYTAYVALESVQNLRTGMNVSVYVQ
ncbi:MAG: HlyD family efflux transporter periplasmic adaptor subunit [Candidatus Limiplasma sp.]|nr:HlyD family efflux transporter periplasmic adaptor subunit [Candidatus Limiplasma sp.]